MPSFDIVSKVEMQEITNAVTHSLKEIAQRFDFKGSKSTIEFLNNEIKVLADDDYKLDAVKTILFTKLNKRGISPKSIEEGKVESASGGMLRQVMTIIQGLATEKSKEINKFIKENKFKVNSEIQKDQLRVTSKSRDELQTVIAALKGKDFGPPLQFINFRE
jgi:uncharacterized protein YajQ (UPF0234 family)